jgi:hypothetical protein
VERQEIERYLLVEDWLPGQMQAVKIRERRESTKEGFPHTFVFDPERELDRLAPALALERRRTLVVTYLQFWHLAYEQSPDAVSALRAQADVAVGGFEVRFVLDQQRAAEELRALIRRVRTPVVFGTDRGTLQEEALEHLFSGVVCRLRAVKNHPEHYLTVAVKNFYRDKLRGARRAQDMPPEGASDLSVAGDLSDEEDDGSAESAGHPPD